jgi:NAD+--asparagine ADP-ribosyltransferase
MFMPTKVSPVVAIAKVSQVALPELAKTRAALTVGVRVGAMLATDWARISRNERHSARRLEGLTRSMLIAMVEVSMLLLLNLSSG